MPDIFTTLGISGLAAAIPVISIFLWIRRDLRAANKDREARLVENIKWRSSVDSQLDRLNQWRMSVDSKLDDISKEVHIIVRRMDRYGINGK